MTAIKSYTGLEQSKKLAEILPPESADMHWQYVEEDNRQLQWFCLPKDFSITRHNTFSAWSLASLLDVLPNESDIVKGQSDDKDGKYMCTVGYKNDILSTFSDNPIDACVAMIEKLKELNLL